MPECPHSEPELYSVDETQVRCLLYADHAAGAEPATATEQATERSDHEVQPQFA